MTTDHPLPDRITALDSIHLGRGEHGSRGDGMCAMEAVAYLAGEPHSDYPQCACPVLGSFVRSWNDGLLVDADRDRILKPFVARLVGTRAAPQVEVRRALLAMDWLVRVNAPAWLGVASLAEHAAQLRALPALDSTDAIEAALPAIRAALEATAAQWPAGAADWAANWYVTGDASRDAAGNAAGDAWDAAGGGVLWASWAAWAASWAASGVSSVAAVVASEDAIATTVAALQTSACDLLDRMIRVGGDQ